MRIVSAFLVIAAAVITVSILQGRVQHWSAARADYTIAVQRIADTEADGKHGLNLSDLKNLSDLPPEIATITGLKRLHLSDTNLTDISLLAGLGNLEYLSMNNVPIRDISPLSRLTRLVDLSISRTWVFDLTPIAGLSRIQQLNLSYTAVKSLEPVLQLRRLRQLTLYSSYAHDGSQAFYNKLSRTLPRVNNGSAYRQNYKPDWQYRMKIRFKRFRQSWMVDRPKIS